MFEERCLEAYETAGTVEVGRWLLKILVREAISIYKEYVDMTVDLLENHPDARRALWLGTIFLAGTWIALFFMVDGIVSGFITGPLPGTSLVLANALLVARSFMRSERMAYVAGMAAMANVFLMAGLMTVQASLEQLPLVSLLAQIILLGLHGILLWRLRGEDLTRAPQEFEIGD